MWESVINFIRDPLGIRTWKEDGKAGVCRAAGLMTHLIYLMKTFEPEWALSGSKWVALILPCKAFHGTCVASGRGAMVLFYRCVDPQSSRAETVQRISSCRHSTLSTNGACEKNRELFSLKVNCGALRHSVHEDTGLWQRPNSKEKSMVHLAFWENRVRGY